MLPIIILAGGLGTRISKYIGDIPKSLALVNNIPFIDHQLIALKKQGFTDVVISIGYKGEFISNYVGNGNKYGLNIIYSDDGENFLGTGGAIKKAAKYMNDSFFILYGDSYLPINFLKVEKKFFEEKKLGLLTIFKNNNNFDKSNVHYNGGEIISYSKSKRTYKMKYIDYGLSILNKTIFSNYDFNKVFDLSECFVKLIHEKEITPYIVEERFYEIGTIDGFIETENYIKNLGSIN